MGSRGEWKGEKREERAGGKLMEEERIEKERERREEERGQKERCNRCVHPEEVDVFVHRICDRLWTSAQRWNHLTSDSAHFCCRREGRETMSERKRERERERACRPPSRELVERHLARERRGSGCSHPTFSTIEDVLSPG